MRVFVTGAAGFIGRAVVQELIDHGHQVLGLARNDANADAISKAGAEPHRGDLEDTESLKTAAKAVDGIIHLAFIHDFSNFPKSLSVDRTVIETIGEAIAGTGKPFVIASGTLILPGGVLATEETGAVLNHPLSERAKSAELIYALSKDKQIRGSVIRLPPTVHGVEDKGFVPNLINIAREKGYVTYIDDGSTRWPAAHRLDAAVLFRLALEKGTAGATYHAVAEQGVAMKDMMTVIGKHLQLPVKSKSVNEAMEAMGFFAHVISRDNPTSSEKTQKELGWHPKNIGLLADIEANYFS